MAKKPSPDLDAYLRIALKIILLIFILSLIIFFIYSLFDGQTWKDKALASGISLSGISGIIWLYIKFDMLTIAMKNPKNLNDQTVLKILESKSNS